MIGLTARQIQILKLIVEEYIQTALPVGSENLDKKFNRGVSPATIRNEMVYLTKQGYLTKSHSSSGRLPTAMALKLYVNELMKERELSVTDEVSAKEKVWENRHNINELMSAVARALAQRTHAIGLVMSEDFRIQHSGYANLLNMPEFYDIRVMRDVLNLIEEERTLNEIFRFGNNENPVRIIYGGELGNKNLEPISFVYTDVHTAVGKFYLAVLGSSRFDYPYVVPMMRYFKKLLEEMISG
ncbi:hypothetical protein FWH30_00370 [Microgenomates group bacterium]|nr:hypothetical protein [Microgenomates group bacterium]